MDSLRSCSWLQSSQEPGRPQVATQLRMHEGVPGLPSPGTLWDRLCLASHKGNKLPLLLGQLQPRAIAGLKPCSGNRFAPLLPLDAEEGRLEASWRPPPSASRGRLCLPLTPSQSSEPVGLLLHWWLAVPGALLHSSRLRFSRLASQARRSGEPCSSSIAKLGTFRWAGQQAGPILVPPRCVLWSRP